MGSGIASQLAEDVRLKSIRLDIALSYHLLNNHYPPLPRALIPVCKAVIKRANNGNNLNSEVKLPKGITYKGRKSAPLYECIKEWHLDCFINDDQEF